MTAMLDDATLDAIATRVAERVLARLAKTEPPPLVTKDEIATALRVSPAQVNRYAKAGMPRHYIGKGRGSPRFIVSDCRTWIAEHANERQALGEQECTLKTRAR